MPELPEVEVLRASLEPSLVGTRIERVDVVRPDLREPIPEDLERRLRGRRIEALRRRAKYLLIDLGDGDTLVVHLGMSGRLTLVDTAEPAEAHEHVAFYLDSGRRLRLRDPRRFGLVFASETASLSHDRHFAHLGIEPLDRAMTGSWLRRAARGRRAPVKSFLMDAKVVVGVGNIYASEALFRSGIHPNRSVARIGEARWNRLARAVQDTLADAIEEGGTTLNDFADGGGNPGYFQVSLAVYGREGEPCTTCGHPVRRAVHSTRSTFYCARCQK